MSCGPSSIYDVMREQMSEEIASEKLEIRKRKTLLASAQLKKTASVHPQASPASRYIDIHETLKQEALGTDSLACINHSEKSRPCPSVMYGISDQYIILDSFEKVRNSTPEQGQYIFNFMVQGVTRDQNIGVKDKLDTITGIQVTDFCIPLLSYDNFDSTLAATLTPSLAMLSLTTNGALPATGDATTNSQSQIPFCSRVTMYLKEIGMQSYSDSNNRRHHFEFDSTVVGADVDRISLKPLKNFDLYLFTDPIQDIHGLTVQFYNPGNPVRFAPDVLYGVTARTDALQLLEFTYTDPTNLINVVAGDRIFIKGFSSDNSTLNSWITREEGHIVGTGGYVLAAPTGPDSGSTLTFRLNPDVLTSGLTPTVIAANTVISSRFAIDIYIAKNRIRIPMRFRRVVDRLTNYIAP
jgi:hypothetical protein